MSLVTAFASPLRFTNSPPVPIDASRSCGMAADVPFKLVPNYIGTAFGMRLYIVDIDCRLRRTCVDLSAFIIIVWCTCRSRRRGMLRFSGLIRSIVTDATIYFLATITAQIYSIVGVHSFAFFPRSP